MAVDHSIVGVATVHSIASVTINHSTLLFIFFLLSIADYIPSIATVDTISGYFVVHSNAPISHRSCSCCYEHFAAVVYCIAAIAIVHFIGALVYSTVHSIPSAATDDSISDYLCC